MNAVYWDTSALLKLYAPEADSAGYLRILSIQHGDVAISFLHRVELFFALRQKEARAEIAEGAARKLFASFENDVHQRRYLMIPWGADVVSTAQQTLEQCLTASPPVALRSLDGLHLGALLATGINRLITADNRMKQAAAKVGLRLVEP